MGEFLVSTWNYPLVHMPYGIKIVNVVEELEYFYFYSKKVISLSSELI